MSELRDLSLFPAKGMRRATLQGEYIDELKVTPTGFELGGVGDREIYATAPDKKGGRMVITPRGRMTAQGREHEYVGDRALKRVGVDIVGRRQLRLTADGIGLVDLNLDIPAQEDAQPAALHKGEVWGYDLGGEAAEFIRAVTGRDDATLMRIDRNAPRLVGPDQSRSSLAADSQPFSLASAISLDVLNDQRHTNIPMRRYRPNMEVDNLGGAGSFAEHDARRIQIGDQTFRVAAGIVRCVVTNLEEDGAMVGGGLSLLRSRRGHRVDSNGVPEGGQPEPIFCVSLNVESSQKKQDIVTVGMPVDVLEWGNPNVLLA